MSNHPDTRGRWLDIGPPMRTASRRTSAPCEVCGDVVTFVKGEQIPWYPWCRRCAREIAKARAYYKRLTPEQRARYAYRTEIRERAASPW